MKKDRNFQRILWRNNENEPMQCYPDSIEESQPHAATAIRSAFYMDDLMFGSDNVDGAVQVQKVIHKTLNQAGFPLVKYRSNSRSFLESMDNDLVNELKSIEFASED